MLEEHFRKTRNEGVQGTDKVEGRNSIPNKMIQLAGAAPLP